MELSKYSFGTGDRFGLQGKAQLAAIEKARSLGVDLAIVWNKSHREHTIIGTDQKALRGEADDAVRALKSSGQYLVDADHIGLETVDQFMDSSDFFTLDVADFIGKAAGGDSIATFIDKMNSFVGSLVIPGIDIPLEISAELLQQIAEKYLYAVQEAAKIYQYIESKKGTGNFITEVSMDETAEPQSPVEMLFILAALAEEKVPLQTIAPKFSGRFNKGVDYLGDVDQFRREFEEDLCVIAYAVEKFGLPGDLKLSVHSGSDKFSIYGPIRELIKKHNAGIHVKTAGTTWLEELIGLAEAGGSGLEIAKQVYAASYDRFDELCSPYFSVIDIDRAMLPTPDAVNSWTSDQYVKALRHDQSCPEYNVNVRQLLHVGYKVAAEMGQVYLDALVSNEAIVAKNVTGNLYDRHIVPLFI
jgi:tagaturonate epimerase